MLHLLITRFSVPTTLAGKWRDVSEDLAYLQFRMRLFRLFCVPSIEAQTDQDFKWFVLFGQDSPAWLADEIESFGALFIPLYCKNLEAAVCTLKEWVGVHAKAGDMVLSSRLDNDDAIAVNYMAKVKGSIRPNVDVMHFDFTHGHQVVISNKPESWKFYSLKYPQSPFASMAERYASVEKLKLILHKPHGSLRPGHVDGPVITVSTMPTWLQVLHGKNIGNRLMSKNQVIPSFEAFPWLEPYLLKGLPGGACM